VPERLTVHTGIVVCLDARRPFRNRLFDGVRLLVVRLVLHPRFVIARVVGYRADNGRIVGQCGVSGLWVLGLADEERCRIPDRFCGISHRRGDGQRRDQQGSREATKHKKFLSNQRESLEKPPYESSVKKCKSRFRYNRSNEPLFFQFEQHTRDEAGKCLQQNLLFVSQSASRLAVHDTHGTDGATLTDHRRPRKKRIRSLSVVGRFAMLHTQFLNQFFGFRYHFSLGFCNFS
jgi:hypothetical protein